jgi:hypothetical protein
MDSSMTGFVCKVLAEGLAAVQAVERGRTSVFIEQPGFESAE